MQTIQDLAELRDLYGEALPNSLSKVVSHLTPLYKQWIEAARFAIVATSGPRGVDASPRGDTGPVAQVVDEHTLWLPDWQGNNRLDSLTNIVSDGHISLMFMVHGSNNVVRVNGNAVLTTSSEITSQFSKQDKKPKSVIVTTVGEAYFQCAKSIMRSQLWVSPETPADVPSAGQFLREVESKFDSDTYDSGYSEYAKKRMW